MLPLALISVKEMLSGCQCWGRDPHGSCISGSQDCRRFSWDWVCETSVLQCCCGSAASHVLGPRSCRSQAQRRQRSSAALRGEVQR